jgi:isoleucyl-tRNA synthetase
MLQWMAPFLSFTAEEAWKIFSHGTEHKQTIFTSEFQTIPMVKNSSSLLHKWLEIRKIRQDVTKAIEIEREAGRIGSSLQAEIIIEANDEHLKTLSSLGSELKFVLITSSAEVKPISDELPLQIAVRSSSFLKCSRCWHYTTEVGTISAHLDLCARCDSNLHAAGETRSFA